MTRTQIALVSIGIGTALLFSGSALYRRAEQAVTYTPAVASAVERSDKADNQAVSSPTVDKLLALGGRRWTRYGFDRVYFDSKALGVELPAGTKTFFDVTTGDFTGPSTAEVQKAVAGLKAAIN